MERIIQKIGKIHEYLTIIYTIKDDCINKIYTDPIYKGALLHYLYLLSDSCISLAELVIKYKKLRVPQTYHEAIDILGENNILNPDFAYSFAKIAGFRNYLAHDYDQLDTAIICNEILKRTKDIEEYLVQIKNSLGIKYYK
ncbi:MAG TPA: DUF86 domain-containing protein [Spirochaetota bacterium]|nr:DUF86 domain-containing protein [Spirochaetota bacterium]HPP51019.1 DUF86 domain-containing protein [Spirochaetota bacterium]HXK65171.1 DUF86 domain-containing protein [Spirochaetota bacterium]